MSRKLIVNADDFGRSPGVSQGILHAHLEGIVTSTTVMVNQPGVEAQLAQALACPNLGVGLHLVFSHGRPILAPQSVRSLVASDGRFLDQDTLWADAPTVSPKDLHAELSAQIERFTVLSGRAPDHLDCHHFAHLHSPFFQVYAGLAARHQLPLRVPFPLHTQFQDAPSSLPFLEGFPPDLVRGLIVTNSALIKALHLAHPDRFIDTFFGRAALSQEYLLRLLDSLPEGTSELMCHPGYSDADLASSFYRQERESELALLTSPEIRARIQRLGIELVTYATLG